MTHARRTHTKMALAGWAHYFLKIQTRPTSSFTRLHQAYIRLVCLVSFTLHLTAPDRRAYALGGYDFAFVFATLVSFAFRQMQTPHET